MSEEGFYLPITCATELIERYKLGERNFKKVELPEADFSNAYLSKVELPEANLSAASFKGANLRQANLSAADLRKADLRRTNLSSANLKDANLKDSNLKRADLSTADLKRANMSSTSLELCQLQKADLLGADLRGANLHGALLMEARLEKADLTYADLSDTRGRAQGGITGANLAGANIRAASLRGANLQGADLRGADLRGTNLKEALLEGSLLQGAYYDAETVFPGGVNIRRTGMQHFDNKTSSSNIWAGLWSPYLKYGIRALGLVGIGIVVYRLVIIEVWRAGKTPLASSIEIDEPTQPEVDANQPVVKVKAAKKPTPKVQVVPPTSATPTPVTQGISCPALIRTVNAVNPDRPFTVDVMINGKPLMSNVPFGMASRYVGVPPGELVVQVTKAGTTTVIEEGKLTAIPNGAYSVAIAGNLPDPPQGKLLVISEDLSPPHAGKFKGGWYQLSEINTETDLRISKSATPNVEQARLVKVFPKTGVNYSELDAGSYNFNPVLPGKSAVLLNNAYNPAIRVEARAKIPSGWLFDVFAIGNPINKGANSLKLYTASYRILPSRESECTQVQ